MPYTRKGDKGDTYAFGCDQRFSKSSELAEVLGAVDEVNSLLGFCKVRAQTNTDNFFNIPDIIERVQQDLFIIQANLAGAKDKKITSEEIQYLEKIIDAAEKEMPEIKTFFLSGGTELSTLFDYGRAVARRAERRVVAFSEKEKDKVLTEILAYLNRLSSFLYALARYVNFKNRAKETPPSY